MNISIETNIVNDLDEVLNVSTVVFNPSHEEIKKYHNKEDWLNKIRDGGLLITAKYNNVIIGFAICYPRDHRLHIWNVGVLKEHRRSGVWTRMYAGIIKYAKQKHFNEISLNTYKDKFPKMYEFCINHGFTEIGFNEGKSSFVKKVDD